MKKIILIIIIFLILWSYLSVNIFAKGIIIANNKKIIDIFRSHDQKATLELIEKIDEYDKIIIHMGAEYVFRKGSAFYYKSSQENLKFFCKTLKTRDKKIYLWFLDSFGSNQFNSIYQEHREIIDDNYNFLEKLEIDYDGIVIDLEWINLPDANNTAKYLDILKYLDFKFTDSYLAAFLPLIDNPSENKNRGYPEKEILNSLDNIITMLYLKDGDFFLKNEKLNLYINSSRTEDLRKYYQSKKYLTALSLQQGIILQRNENLYFIKSSTGYNYKNKSRLFYKKEEKYYNIYGYEIKENFSIIKDDGTEEIISSTDKIHFLELKKEKLINDDDYLWEFFLLNE